MEKRSHSRCDLCQKSFGAARRPYSCDTCHGSICSSCSSRNAEATSSSRICKACKERSQNSTRDLESQSDCHSISEEDLELTSILGIKKDEIYSSSAKTVRERRSARDAEKAEFLASLMDMGWQGGKAGAKKVRKEPHAADVASSKASLVEHQNNLELDLGALRKAASQERLKAETYRSSGLTTLSKKAMAKSKELESHAKEIEAEMARKKNGERVLGKAALPGAGEITAGSEGSNLKKLDKKVELDLADDLKELGWEDDDAGKKSGMEGGEEFLAVKRARVLELKKKALMLKRDGKVKEALAELKSAKALEKEIEEAAALGFDIDGKEDDSDEDILKEIGLDIGAELKGSEFTGAIEGNVVFDLTSFDLAKIQRFGEDLDVDVSDFDVVNPEMEADLAAFGWESEEEEPVDVAEQIESLKAQLLEAKRTALTQKRQGNVKEALAALKQSKAIEKEIRELEESVSAAQAPAGPMREENVGLKRLNAGKAALAAPLDALSALVHSMPDDEDSADEDDVEVTEEDEMDPEISAALANFGLEPERNERVESQPSSKPVKAAETKTAVTGLQIADVSAEVKALKMKALGLKRAGKVTEAMAALNQAKALERREPSAFPAAATQASGTQSGIGGKPVQKVAGPQVSMDEIAAQLRLDDEEESEVEEVEVTEEDEDDPDIASALEAFGFKDSQLPVSQKRPQTEEVRGKQTIVAHVEPEAVQVSAESEIKALKLKALGFKREGKVKEAMEALRKARLLENQGQVKLQETKQAVNPNDVLSSGQARPPSVPQRAAMAQFEARASKSAGGAAGAPLSALDIMAALQDGFESDESDDVDVTEDDEDDPDIAAALQGFGFKPEPAVSKPAFTAEPRKEAVRMPVRVAAVESKALWQEATVGKSVEALRVGHALEGVQRSGKGQSLAEVPTHSAVSLSEGRKSAEQLPVPAAGPRLSAGSVDPRREAEAQFGSGGQAKAAAAVKTDSAADAAGLGSVQDEIEQLKVKALALKREGKMKDALEAFRKAKALESSRIAAEQPPASGSDRPILREATSAPEQHAGIMADHPAATEKGSSSRQAVPAAAAAAGRGDVQLGESKEQPLSYRDSSQGDAGHQQQAALPGTGVEAEIKALKLKAVTLKREGNVKQAVEALRQARLLESGPKPGSEPAGSAQDMAQSTGPAADATGSSRKAQEQIASHKRRALLLKREGNVEAAKKELLLARKLEADLAGSPAGAAVEKTGPPPPPQGRAAPRRSKKVVDDGEDIDEAALDADLAAKLKSLGLTF